MASLAEASANYAQAFERAEFASSEVKSLKEALVIAEHEDSRAYKALQRAESELRRAAVEEHSE